MSFTPTERPTSPLLKSSTESTVVPWLIRVPEVFDGFAVDVIKHLGATSSARFGTEYHLIKLPAGGQAIRRSEVGPFVQWNLPIHHSWPCNPQKMDGFIEKAAQTIWKKFGHLEPQAILIGQLHPSSPSPYYKSLASNLRGRTLQLFPKLSVSNAEEQNGGLDTLFCLVGKEGLFCGLQSPLDSNGFYAGGTKFISQESPETISRAGAKVAEAIHYLGLYRPPFPAGTHWVELGASPGGMTSELLARGQRVTAVDRAPLDARLQNQPRLTFSKADAASFEPKRGTVFDVILSDLNGDAQEAISYVTRLVPFLREGGLVIFTLKISAAESVQEALNLYQTIEKRAEVAGLSVIAKTHLTYNRKEFTLFFERERK